MAGLNTNTDTDTDTDTEQNAPQPYRNRTATATVVPSPDALYAYVQLPYGLRLMTHQTPQPGLFSSTIGFIKKRCLPRRANGVDDYNRVDYPFVDPSASRVIRPAFNWSTSAPCGMNFRGYVQNYLLQTTVRVDGSGEEGMEASGPGELSWPTLSPGLQCDGRGGGRGGEEKEEGDTEKTDQNILGVNYTTLYIYYPRALLAADKGARVRRRVLDLRGSQLPLPSPVDLPSRTSDHSEREGRFNRSRGKRAADTKRARVKSRLSTELLTHSHILLNLRYPSHVHDALSSASTSTSSTHRRPGAVLSDTCYKSLVDCAGRPSSRGSHWGDVREPMVCSRPFAALSNGQARNCWREGDFGRPDDAYDLHSSTLPYPT